MPALRWDERVDRYRAPAYLHDRVCEALRAAGDVEAEGGGWPKASAGSAPALEVRPYQAAAVRAWRLAGKRGVVALPTGAGKTRVAIAAALEHDRATLFVVPTRVLLAQWIRAIEELTGRRPGCLGDGESEVLPWTVATFESAYRHMARLGDRFALIVADEAHHFARGERQELLEMSMASARLGLTATPPREPRQLAELGRLIGPVVFELGIDDLAGRFLAPYELFTLTLPLSRDERAAYDAHMLDFLVACREFFRQAPLGAWPDLVRVLGRTEHGRETLAGFRAARQLLCYTEAKAEALASLLEQHRDARVLVFTADNATAYAIARRHLVMPLTCDISRAERALALERFARGELRCLVSARVLNEGFDVPAAEVGVVIGGSQGEREHVQRVGRLLRPQPGKRALIYELVTASTMEVRQASRRRVRLGA